MKQANSVTQISITKVVLNIGGTDVEWDCTGGSFTRDTLSVISTDPTTGVQIVNSPSHLCKFVVSGAVGSGIPQIVKLDFTLEQRNPAGASEFETSIPFEVTVGTRNYTTN